MSPTFLSRYQRSSLEEATLAVNLSGCRVDMLTGIYSTRRQGYFGNPSFFTRSFISPVRGLNSVTENSKVFLVALGRSSQKK